MRKILSALALMGGFVFSSCNNTAEKNASTKDTLIKKGPDSTAFLFKTNIPPTAAKGITLIMEDDKRVTLDKFPAYSQDDVDRYGTDWDGLRDSSTRCLIDLNNDNKVELITQYCVGNPDEWNCFADIFIMVSENTYKRIGHYTNQVSIDKNGLSLNFSSELKQFSNCYYCDLSDTIKLPINIPTIIKLELRNGAFAYAGKNDRLNEEIETNLKALKARGIPNMRKNEDLGPGSALMDDGTRNTVAAHIVTYYFNNSRDMAKTKEFFLKYYDNADKNKMWKMLEEYINDKIADLQKQLKFQ